MISRRDVMKSMAVAGLGAVPVARIAELDMSQNAVVVIHSNHYFRQEDLHRFKDALAARIGRDVTVINMPTDAVLEALPEADMNAHGWFRK